jgi:hypothetical protein
MPEALWMQAEVCNNKPPAAPAVPAMAALLRNCRRVEFFFDILSSPSSFLNI